MFVVAEEMSNAERATPNTGLLWSCSQILAAEVAIDVLKHAVLGRFNEIRPGVYREFMRVRLSCCHDLHCTELARHLRRAKMLTVPQLTSAMSAGRLRARAGQSEPQYAPRGGLRPSGSGGLLHPRGAHRAGRAQAARWPGRACQAGLAPAAQPGTAGRRVGPGLRGQGALEVLVLVDADSEPARAEVGVCRCCWASG